MPNEPKDCVDCQIGSLKWIFMGLFLLGLSSFMTMILIVALYYIHQMETERRVAMVVSTQKRIAREFGEREYEHAQNLRLLRALATHSGMAAEDVESVVREQ